MLCYHAIVFMQVISIILLNRISDPSMKTFLSFGQYGVLDHLLSQCMFEYKCGLRIYSSFIEKLGIL